MAFEICAIFPESNSSHAVRGSLLRRVEELLAGSDADTFGDAGSLGRGVCVEGMPEIVVERQLRPTHRGALM